MVRRFTPAQRPCRSLARDLLVDALDVEVHAQDLSIVQVRSSLAFDGLALLIDHRALEWVQVAIADRSLSLHGELLYVIGHVGIRRHEQHLRLETAPDVARGPLVVEQRLHALDVIRTPVVDDGGELSIGTELDHVGVLSEGIRASRFGDLHRRRAVGVLHDHVGALVEQRLAGVGLLAGIEPRIDPDDLDLDPRIDGLGTEDGGIDSGDYLRDRERADIAEHTRLRHLGGDPSLDIAAFIEPGRIGCHVLVALVAGVVLEENVRIFLCDLDRRVHVAERCGEDQLVAGAGQLLDRALGVRALIDVLEERGLDLGTELLHDELPAELMLVGPAEIANRSKINESDLELALGGCVEDAYAGRKCRRCGSHNDNISHVYLRVLDGRFEFLRSARRPSTRAAEYVNGLAQRPDQAMRAQRTSAYRAHARSRPAPRWWRDTVAMTSAARGYQNQRPA